MRHGQHEMFLSSRQLSDGVFRREESLLFFEEILIKVREKGKTYDIA